MIFITLHVKSQKLLHDRVIIWQLYCKAIYLNIYVYILYKSFQTWLDGLFMSCCWLKWHCAAVWMKFKLQKLCAKLDQLGLRLEEAR